LIISWDLFLVGDFASSHSRAFSFNLVDLSIGWNLPSSAFCKAAFVDRLGLFMVSQISWTFCVMTFLNLVFSLTDESISSIIFLEQFGFQNRYENSYTSLLLGSNCLEYLFLTLTPEITSIVDVESVPFCWKIETIDIERDINNHWLLVTGILLVLVVLVLVSFDYYVVRGLSLLVQCICILYASCTFTDLE
ncbi:hypothetical protein STEG23_031792, partial [Scotinomys teguina]